MHDGRSLGARRCRRRCRSGRRQSEITVVSIRNCSVMCCACAQGPADADLLGALGHGRQHDVHDPDPADDQRRSSAMPTMMKLNMRLSPLGVAQDLDRRLDLDSPARSPVAGLSSRRSPRPTRGPRRRRSLLACSQTSVSSICLRSVAPACTLDDRVAEDVAGEREREVDVLVEVAAASSPRRRSPRAGRWVRARRRRSAA